MPDLPDVVAGAVKPQIACVDTMANANRIDASKMRERVRWISIVVPLAARTMSVSINSSAPKSNGGSSFSSILRYRCVLSLQL